MLQTKSPPTTQSTIQASRRSEVTDPDYVRYIRAARKDSLPPESLATDYRAACKAGLMHARDAVAYRLFAAEADLEKDESFLRVVRIQAKKIARVRRDLTEGDFVRLILDEIIDTLPTSRGAHAEVDWDSYCYQRSLDVAERELAKKRQQDVHELFPEDVEPVSDTPLPDADPVDRLTGYDPEFAQGLWAVVERVASAISDPDFRLIVLDQFGPSPSKKSGTKWRSKVTGKPSLLVQLGWEQTPTNRDRVARMTKRASDLIRAEILKAIESGDLVADPLFLRDWHLDNER